MAEKEIEYNGVTMHYTVSGDGPALILMHGWGCNHTTVASIEHIAINTHTVYNVDFPGFGKSSEPETVWGTEEYTRLIEHLAEVENIKSPTLIGHSFGGRIAIIFASRNKTEKVILVDAAGVKPKRSLKYYCKVYSFKISKWIVNHTLSKTNADRIIDNMRAKNGSSDYAGASNMMRAILSKVVNEDLTPLMPLIKAPTLLIWGENDTATPLKDAKVMEKLIPDAGLVSFTGCGHYSFLDNPMGFRAVLSNFLKS